MYPFFNHVFWYQNHGPQPSAQIALATPKPTSGKSPASMAINKFFAKAEKDYEKLVNQYTIGDSLVYKGRKK